MTTLSARRPASRGRLAVLVLYGALLAQLGEFAAYTNAGLPKTANLAQFACIGLELVAWTGLIRLTREFTGPRRHRLDERELAIRDRSSWIALRLLSLALVVLTGGYVLLHDGAGWLPAPSPQWLSLIAFAACVVISTLPSAVLAWTHPPQSADHD